MPASNPFQGEVYHTCTDVDSEVLWCATKVDGDGVAVDHFWGEGDMVTCTSDGAYSSVPNSCGFFDLCL